MIIKRGMDNAVPIALYTTAISLTAIYSDRVPLLSVVAMVMLLMGPLLVYVLQRRFFLETEGECGMWGTWRMGVVAIFFGTVFTLLATYLTLEYLRPGYLYDQMQMLIDTYKSMPETKGLPIVAEMQDVVDNNQLPSAFSYALNMFVMTNLSGMVMCMVTGLVASRAPGVRF